MALSRTVEHKKGKAQAEKQLATSPSSKDTLSEFSPRSLLDTPTPESSLQPQRLHGPLTSGVTKILILSSNTGGGHRASAQALKTAFEDCTSHQTVIQIVDFWVDLARGPFTKFPQQYAYLAKHPWLWKLTYELTRFPPARLIAETYFNTLAHSRIRDAFLDFQPDLVVSVHPLVNTLTHRVIDGLVKRTWKVSPAFVTVVTDLGGAHPTWFHKRVDRVYVPTDNVKQIAGKCGVPSVKIEQMGLPVRREFWDGCDADRSKLRDSLGLRRERPAILLVGGGDGVGRLGRIAKVIASKIAKERGRDAAQLVVVCGKNTRLLNDLNRYKWPLQEVLVKGYVNNMSDWMTACDFLCTKAGPGTIAEALICGLPLLITGFLPGQEVQNVTYVVEHGVGSFASRSKDIANIANQWVGDPEELQRMSLKAKELGEPHASCNIVKNVLEVCEEKKVQNEIYLENVRRIEIVKQHLARVHLHGYGHDVHEGSLFSHSILLRQVRAMLGIFFGAAIAREALSYPTSQRVSQGRRKRQIER